MRARPDYLRFVEHFKSIVARRVSLWCRGAKFHGGVKHALKQGRTVDLETGPHESTECIACKSEDRSTLLFIMECLRMFHVGRGKDISLCTARNLVL